MNKWLENFAYRAHLNWSTFALATVVAVVIAWVTVAYQSIKVACADPVKALKYE